jgi:hypothetical protein
VRRLGVQRHCWWSRQAKDPNEIDRLTARWLVPQAQRWYGAASPPVDPAEVRRLALVDGRFDVVFCDGAIVGCRVGYTRTMFDSRFWVNWLTGYDERVADDPRRLDDARSMNAFLDLEHAIEARYNYYDMGSSSAAPFAADVQWKRARGGLPVALESHEWLSVTLPRRGAASFLWESPLIGSDRGHLSVWAGCPAGRSDDELVEHCRPLRFDGLRRLFLHTERELSPAVLDAIRALFAVCVEPPELVTVNATA